MKYLTDFFVEHINSVQMFLIRAAMSIILTNTIIIGRNKLKYNVNEMENITLACRTITQELFHIHKRANKILNSQNGYEN